MEGYYFLLFLFILSFVTLAWLLSSVGDLVPSIGADAKAELGRLVFNNYRVDKFESIHPIDVNPEEITLVSGSVGERLWAPLSKKRLHDYADQHGYNVFYFIENVNDEVPGLWQKIYAVKEAFQDPACQVLVWIDDDIFITAPERPIEDFLAMTDKPMIFSADLGIRPGDGSSYPPEYYWNVINAGFFILRKSPEAISFIEDVIAGRENLYNGYWNTHTFHDQSVMTYYLYSKYLESFTIMPLGYLQVLHRNREWRPGHFSVHFAGENGRVRYEGMTKLINNSD